MVNIPYPLTDSMRSSILLPGFAQMCDSLEPGRSTAFILLSNSKSFNQICDRTYGHFIILKFVYYPPYLKISAQALLKMCRIRDLSKIVTHDFRSYVKNHIKTRHHVIRRLRLKGSMSKRSSTSASRPSIDFLMSVYPNATYIFSAMLISPNMSISMQAALPQQLTEIPRQALLLLPAADVSLLIAWCQSAEA